MPMRFCTATLLLATGLPPALAECEFERRLSLDLDARGAEELRLETHAGSLELRGAPGLDTARVTGRACASDERLLERMALEDRSRGSRLAVITRMPDADGGWFQRSYARIDVTVELPDSLFVEIDDGSGETILSGVGPALVRDGSGDIRIEDARGEVELRDGSGGIRVRGAAGDVRVEDGSGEIAIDGVQGSVTIEEDGSGEIDIRNVARDVLVVDDGSGSIDVRDVVGSVTIEDDGSGSIEVRDVGGSFVVESDGSGGVRYSGVEGAVRVPGEDDRRLR